MLFKAKDNLIYKILLPCRYTYGFFFCELLNIAILVAQIFMTDSFLGGQFYMYGLDLYRYHRLTTQQM